MSAKRVYSAVGIVQGPHSQETLVCQFAHMTNAQGRAWFGGDLFAFSLPVLLLQFVSIFAITAAVWFLIKPLKQGLISAQLIAGIIMGQSFLGRMSFFSEKLFNPGGVMVLETLADLGFMFHLFVLGVHVDLSLVKRVGRNAVVIGAVCYFLPFTLGLALILILPDLMKIDNSVRRSLPYIVSANAMSSFPVITSLLADLNILNSEIGRIATLASFICDLCNYTVIALFGAVLTGLHSIHWDAFSYVLWPLVFLMITVVGLRSLILLIAKRVPEGQQVKEVHFISIIIVIMICGFGTEIFGQPAALGTFFLGMSIPGGPPLGSVVNKLDTINTGMLVPAKLVLSGLTMDIFSIRGDSGAIFGFVIVFGYAVKFTATLVTALFYDIPVRHSVSLALIMCCRGIIEAVLFITLKEDGAIGADAYAVLLMSILIATGITRPLIYYLYDPSEKYIGQCRNTILNNHPNDELRMMVCIHNADNVPLMINLLEASTPLRHKPIAVFVLNLMELKGRGASVLESTTRKGKLTSSRSWSKHAANAINFFAQRNEGNVAVRHFTSIAPYASMHDDICSLALDQNANVVIIPFHKQWSSGGGVGSNSPSIRMVNQNVIAKSPCSVGILIDRGQVSGAQPVSKGHSISMFRITLLFLGGPDDCEALAYATRFIENPQILLTLIWIRSCDHKNYAEEMENGADIELVSQFRANTIGNERIGYREELVQDAIGTTSVIRSIEEGCDLCIVGRYHEADSPLLIGLTEWSEFPELGLVGDALAASDVNFSVLVMQQRPLTATELDGHVLNPMACGYGSSTHCGDNYSHPVLFQESCNLSTRT